MAFPLRDKCWTDVADFLRTHLRPNEQILAPVEFKEQFPGLALPYAMARTAHCQWAIVHKGMMNGIDYSFLDRIARSWHLVFANEVFVVFSSYKDYPEADRTSEHYRSFEEKINERGKPLIVRIIHGVTRNLRRWIALRFRRTPRARQSYQHTEKAVPRGEDPLAGRLQQVASWGQRTSLSSARSVLPMQKKRPCVCLSDVSELTGSKVSTFSETMPPNDLARHSLRKWWEWEYLAECAELCDCLNGKHKAVGLGVGDEPLIFYFARFCPHVLATDLYAEDWEWQEARFATVESVLQAAPIEFSRERVEIKRADMRHLGVPDASYDFAWSCSSIEHVPTLLDVLEVFRELARVLRPGGYAFLTTEFCLTEPPYLLPGVNALDAQLFQQIVGTLDAFEVVGEVNLDYNWAHPGNAAYPRRYAPPGLVRTPHTHLMEAFQRGQMANLVGISVIAPIAFVLKRRKGKVPSWEDLPLPRVIYDFTEAVSEVRARKVSAVAGKLQPYVEDGPGEIGLQLYLHIYRYVIEAMAINREWKKLDGALEQFLSCLPPGELQDADCLDLVGYLLGVRGDYAQSAHVYRLAIVSPSTNYNHAIKMSYDYLKSMGKLGRFEEASEFIVNVYCDFIIHGCGPEGLKNTWEKGIGHAEMSATEATTLQTKLNKAIAKACTDFRAATIL